MRPVHSRHDVPPANRPLRLAEECGLTPAQPALTAWPPDRHLLLALLLALPVWAMLGLGFGDHLRAPSGWIAWLSLLMLQPLLEELLFRGILHGQALRLTRRNGRPLQMGPITLANLLVTLGFVALHLRAQPLAWAFAVAVPSLVFGHVRERMGSVWPAVLLHGVYNAGFGLTAWLAQRAA